MDILVLDRFVSVAWRLVGIWKLKGLVRGAERECCSCVRKKRMRHVCFEMDGKMPE
jgi:hypothetical protein